jgi:Bacteriophage head to tail connecting protein
MASDEAKTLIAHYEHLWQQQANFRALWNVAAQFCMPAWDNFIGEFAEGVNRNTRIFDSTAIIANERFAAAMEAMLTPRSQVWAKMKAADEELTENLVVSQYLDRVNKIQFAARYHPEANFASQTDECYMSLGAYGNNCLFIDEVAGRCLRYRSFPLSETVWAPNHQGMVDTLYRKFRYSAKQAVQHWGSKSAVPQAIQRVLATHPYQEFDFLQVIRPNEDCRPFEYGPKNKAYEGWYIYLGDMSVLERGGYRTFPCAIGRYRMAPREHYGRGPATTCLPDVRTANEMVKTGLRMGQKAVDPPTLLAEDSVLTNFNMRPGANNYGMLTQDGKPLAVPFETKANWELGHEMLDGTRQVIRDTFLNTLFQILVQNPNMTATEALLRAQEKGELIAPAMGRQQSEFLGPLIHREIDILSHAGALPPPPMELLRSKRGMTIEYTSPLARALRAEEGTAIMNTFQDLGVIAQVDPSAKFVLDAHDAMREMAQIRGCPAKLVRSEDQVTALMQHAAEQQQQAAMLQQAPSMSQSVLNLAKAGQAASASPTGGSPGAPAVANAA